MTVLENLETGKFNRKERKAEMDEDLDRVYTLFPRLKERAAQAGGTLSGVRTADACHGSCADGAS
jgi:branched-chain amino acid transport system ATP-binding protein